MHHFKRKPHTHTLSLSEASNLLKKNEDYFALLLAGWTIDSNMIVKREGRIKVLRNLPFK